MPKLNEAALRQKALLRLAAAPGGQLTRSELLRSLHVDAATLDVLVGQLVLQGDITSERQPTSGQPKTTYKLLTRTAGDPRLEKLGRLFEAAVRLAVGNE
jgi:hypothetical protein